MKIIRILSVLVILGAETCPLKNTFIFMPRSIFATEKYGRVTFGIDYTRFDNVSQRIEFVYPITSLRTRNYILESSILPFVWTTRDRYNSGKSNFSLSCILHPMLGALTWRGFEKSPDSKPWHNPPLMLLLLLNSRHHLFPFQPHYATDVNFEGAKSFSFSLKNHTDLFVFRKNLWLNVSPGVGISFLFEIIHLQVGYTQSIEFNFDTVRFNPAVYFAVGVWHVGK